jgi:hypothetical protein
MDHLLPWLRLQLTPGLGRVGLRHLIEHFKPPEKALGAAGIAYKSGNHDSGSHFAQDPRGLPAPGGNGRLATHSVGP